MCKVGGPRCDGSHKPSSTQRAKRKANKAYRRALADEIESKTGDADLAKRVRQANMTDLHEIAAIAGISEGLVAAMCTTESYTAPDGETVVVKVEAPGQTRRTEASDESKQLFADVFAATSKRDERDKGTEMDRALMAGDRERAAEINDAVEDISDWVYQTYSDRDAVRGMSDEELIALTEESNQRLRDADRLAGPEALGHHERSDLGRAESELAERGLRFDGTKYSFDPAVNVHVLEEKDDESDEYTKARRMTEQFNDTAWMATDEDYIRNQAMFTELASRASDPDARAAYLEMAERMEKSAAINRTKYRFSDDEFNAITTAGYVRAGITEGRSDKALADMYDELAGLRRNNESFMEGATLDEARSELASELDRRGVVSDRLALDELEAFRKRSMPDNPEELSDAELRDVMERMTQERAEAYARTDSADVRAEADALAGPIAEEYAKRVATMDDLTNVPAYMWPEDTEGKTLPSHDDLRTNAQFYYGLRDASPSESAGLADTDYDVNAASFVGLDPAGNAVYRDGSALYRMTQPSAEDIPNDAHRRDYNTMRLMNAQADRVRDTTAELDDTSDAREFSAAATAYDNLADSGIGRLGGAPGHVAAAKKFLDTHPVPDTVGDDDMHVLADRVRAATAAEDNVSGSQIDGVSDSTLRKYAGYKASQERTRLAKALDTQLRRGGTYNGFEAEHGMTYEKAFKVVEDHESKAVSGGRRAWKVKEELAAAAREGREPKFRTIDNAMKPSAAATADYEKAREIVDHVERTFGTEDYDLFDDRMFSDNSRTAATWNQAGTSERFDDIIDREDTMYPTHGVTFKSKADADVAAAYVRHQSAGTIAKTIAGDTEMVRADGTYSEAYVPKGRVSDEAVSAMLTAVEENVLDSYEHGDDAMRGITRNASGKHDAKVAARNYQAVYAHAVSHIGSNHQYESEDMGLLADDERAEFDDVARVRAAYVDRLGVLYDRAEEGDMDAAEELIETAAASYADDESFMVTRQYVDPDQESLF